MNRQTGIQLPVARYRFSFCVTEPLRLPGYPGSALRGAFGHALRQLACVTKAPECNNCELIGQCPYSRIFEPHEIPRNAGFSFSSMRQVPVPYIIEPSRNQAGVSRPGEIVAINMVLLGDALQQLPLIILAWRRAFLRGVGPGDGKAELLAVEYLGQDGNAQAIYHSAGMSIAAHNAQLSLPALPQQDIHLELLTPMRIEQNKQPLGARQVTAAILLRHLLRRTELLSELYLGQSLAARLGLEIQQLNALCAGIHDERRLSWSDWQRYSSRQRQSMRLGGVSGHWLLKSVPEALHTYLYLGQWLHAGKETVFGMGRYSITRQPWSDHRAGDNPNAI
jgi:hypothetical protein